tara:strand:- start:766 stop:921 length:156 start_codon:yes stop_codon:yes gene_type:complete
MISKSDLINIFLWIIIWNLSDFLIDYFQIKSKEGILISSVLLAIVLGISYF